MKNTVLFALLCLFTVACQKAETQPSIHIVPEPLSVNTQRGNFVLNAQTRVSTQDEALKSAVQHLQATLKRQTGLQLPEENNNKGIQMQLDPTVSDAEAYQLSISDKGIQLKAGTPTGIFYAIQSLLQILPPKPNLAKTYTLPNLTIEDAPKYEYRGLMLDPARHFLPVSSIKKYIDLMAFYKLNKLHLHLSDDQGWRIEIDGYPKLKTVGSKRAETDGDKRPHEGIYTQAELRDLVAYASERHIEVIPEIDMPGHGMSILAAYPQLACFPANFKVRTTPGVSHNLLCAGKPEVYKFYETVIEQVAAIFPASRIHIGGDEAPTDKWEKCPRCQATIKKEQLDDEEGLMSYFFAKIHTLLKKSGKDAQIWYESNVKSYPENTLVYLWRNEDPDDKLQEIKQRGLPMINSYGQNAYFDYPNWKGDIPKTSWMPVVSLEKAYALDPTRGLPEAEASFVKGVEACVWGEYVPNLERAFYMTYPRALALAEAGWSTKGNRNWVNFRSKLETQLQHLLHKGVNYRVPAELFK